MGGSPGTTDWRNVLITQTTMRRSKIQSFKLPEFAQRFVSMHSAVYNTFNIQRHLISRPTLRTFRAEAMEKWHAATAAA